MRQNLTSSTVKLTLLMGMSAMAFSGCFAPKYSPYEKQLVSDMENGKYQPRTNEEREAIETQDLLTQAAFWGREYELNPGDLEAAINLSAALRKMGNPSRAAEITQTTRALYPRDTNLIAEYAAALIATERGVDALKDLDTALQLDRSNARLWSLKGAALDQTERYDQARQSYAQALAIAPGDPKIMANVGLSYALQGDARTAEVWLRNAANQPGAPESVMQNLELVLRLQGKSLSDVSAGSSQSAALPQHSRSRLPAPSDAMGAARAIAQNPGQSRVGQKVVMSGNAMPERRMTAFGNQPGQTQPPQYSGQAPRQQPYQQRGQGDPTKLPLQFNARPGASAPIQVTGNPAVHKGAPRSAREAALQASQRQTRQRGIAAAEMTPEQIAALNQLRQATGAPLNSGQIQQGQFQQGQAQPQMTRQQYQMMMQQRANAAQQTLAYPQAPQGYPQQQPLQRRQPQLRGPARPRR